MVCWEPARFLCIIFVGFFFSDDDDVLGEIKGQGWSKATYVFAEGDFHELLQAE